MLHCWLPCLEEGLTSKKVEWYIILFLFLLYFLHICLHWFLDYFSVHFYSFIWWVMIGDVLFKFSVWIIVLFCIEINWQFCLPAKRSFKGGMTRWFLNTCVVTVYDFRQLLVPSITSILGILGEWDYESLILYAVSRVPTVENHKTGGRVRFKGGYRV